MLRGSLPVPTSHWEVETMPEASGRMNYHSLDDEWLIILSIANNKISSNLAYI